MHTHGIAPILRQRWQQDTSCIPGVESRNTSIGLFIDTEWTSLCTYYCEPWRHYHTIEHIVSFEEALDQMPLCPLSVRIAGYFHDVIWVPGYAQAEERSAEVADRWLRSVGAEEPFRIEVRELIIATKHDGSRPKSMAEAFMRDADLWTLGAPDLNMFLETQKNVRAEFAGVPAAIYKSNRQALFSKMCKTAIYWSGPGKDREARARSNLKSEGIIV